MKLTIKTVLLSCILSAFGCDDQPTTAPDLAPDMSTVEDMSPASVMFRDVQRRVLASCGGMPGNACHGRLAAAAWLDLSEPVVAYASLVNVDSREANDTKRVEPGHPERSFVITKLMNAQGTGEGNGMPQREGGGWAPLQAVDVELFKRWIAQGAKSDADM